MSFAINHFFETMEDDYASEYRQNCAFGNNNN